MENPYPEKYLRNSFRVCYVRESSSDQSTWIAFNSPNRKTERAHFTLKITAHATLNLQLNESGKNTRIILGCVCLHKREGHHSPSSHASYSARERKLWLPTDTPYLGTRSSLVATVEDKLASYMFCILSVDWISEIAALNIWVQFTLTELTEVTMTMPSVIWLAVSRSFRWSPTTRKKSWGQHLYWS